MCQDSTSFRKLEAMAGRPVISGASWRGKPGQDSRLKEFKEHFARIGARREEENPGTARWDPPTRMMEERALGTAGVSRSS